MSHRPINRKKANKLRKMLRGKPDRYINLVQFLKDRRYVRTSGAAEKLILDGRVQAEGEVLGVGQVPMLDQRGEVVQKDVVFPLVAADLRSKIEVVPA